VVDWEADVATHGQQQALLTHYSPRGGEIMTNLMKRSDNLFAEGMLRRLTPGQNRAAAIARERKLLANRGVNFDITDIYDGSGLSRNNRVTANVMADVLTAMANRKGTTVSYVSLFPLVGQEGTVKKLLHGTSLEGKLALKSGSMNGVHCYAGYKLGSDGQPTHAVVILINDFFCSRDEVRTAIATFLKQQFKTTENDESDNR
jgi:D-alanyl-D-alanine carboxypeptidase/D-alanyl-D-alanine-endopeptidase (penicillin-binding protein 4)